LFCKDTLNLSRCPEYERFELDGLTRSAAQASITLFRFVPPRGRQTGQIVGEMGFMYAVIQTGGKQYRVSQGDTLKVEKIAAEAGAVVELDKVLMVADGEDIKVGKPYLNGSRVTATIKSHGRGKKAKIIKFRRRKHHLKRQGHRQWFTELEVTGINAD